MNLRSLRISVLAVLVTWGVAAASHAQVSTTELVKVSGMNQGLCVIIGCGDEKGPSPPAELAPSGKMLVHGIALDDAALARFSAAVSAAGVEGVATVEKLSLKPLPYRDNLVNLLVVTDFEAASAAGLTMQEALRVVAPNGKLCVYKDGKWAVTVKPTPKEMDEWTHEAHGPDGNCVSRDTVVHFPVGFRWNAGLPMNIANPKRTANAWSSTRGLAVMGGRCFTISDSVLENLGPTYASEHGLDQYVTARDAFNGLLLWRKKIGSTYYGGLFYPNRAPFAAVGDSVYVASEDGKLLALSAATGDVAKTFATTYAPGVILIDQNVVAVATWKEGARVGGLTGVDRRRMDFSVGEGTVEAFDAPRTESVRGAQSAERPFDHAQGRLEPVERRLWKIDRLAPSMRSADGILFMVHRAGSDKREEMSFPPPKPGEKPATPPSRPEESVAAVDLRTGKPLWEVQCKTLGSTGPGQVFTLDAAGLGVITVSHDNGAKTSVLSAKEGKLVFQVAAHSYTALYEGAIHLGGKKYDPATGKELGPSTIRLGATICTPSYFVNNIIISNRMGGFSLDGKPLVYGGARGGCLFASIPAYGAFYTPQNWCGCAPAQISGFISFGPIAHELSPAEMEQSPLVEKGPAPTDTIRNSQSAIRNPDDWPMYRHDAQRSNATSSPAPNTLKVLWQESLTGRTPDGLVAADWKEYLNSPLTAPVVAEGIVVTAATDRNQVIALDALTGKELWRRTVGGRVDTPPTLHQGLCLFGSHDGYVYALSCKDGQIAWKMRAAPSEERMVSYGKVESPWPVVGTVLVADGVGYASAGQTQGSDGGIVVRAFDPATGAIRWSKVIAPIQDPASYREMRRNDLMLKVGDDIQLMLTRMNAKTGEFTRNMTYEYQKYLQRLQQAKRAKTPQPQEPPMTLAEVAPDIGLEGFMSWNWTRLGNRKFRTMNFGNVSGGMLSWGEQMISANNQEGQRINPGFFYQPRVEPMAGANAKEGTVIRAISREKVKPFGQGLDAQGMKWESSLPEGYQATAVIVCGNAVVVGGGIYKKDTKEERGFVQILSMDAGAQVAERTFPAPLAYNGIAVAGGRVYATFDDGSMLCLGVK